MSLECSECEHDLRGGHAQECSWYQPPCTDDEDVWDWLPGHGPGSGCPRCDPQREGGSADEQ